MRLHASQEREGGPHRIAVDLRLGREPKNARVRRLDDTAGLGPRRPTIRREVEVESWMCEVEVAIGDQHVGQDRRRSQERRLTRAVLADEDRRALGREVEREALEAAEVLDLD